MKFFKIILLFLIAQAAILSYATVPQNNLSDVVRTAVYLCHALKPIESFDDIVKRFAKALDESNIDPFEQDENGLTLAQIAEKKYQETQRPLCKLVFEELKKYEERYAQKHA